MNLFCTNCGKDLPPETKICPNCGFALSIPEKERPTKGAMQPSSNFYGDGYPDATGENKYNKPLTTAQFFFLQLLFMIPVVNLFFIFFWSLKRHTNKNLKAYSRSILIWLAIASVFSIFALLTFTFMRTPLPFNVFSMRINF